MGKCLIESEYVAIKWRKSVWRGGSDKIFGWPGYVQNQVSLSFFNFVSPALSCLLDPRQFQSTQLNIFSRISTESMQLSCQLTPFCHNYGKVLVKTSLLTTLTFLTLLPINHIFNSATWTSKTYGHILKIKLNPGKIIVRFPNQSQSKSKSSASTLVLPIFTAPQWLCNAARTKIVALFVFQWNFKNRFFQIFHVHKENIFSINLFNLNFLFQAHTDHCACFLRAAQCKMNAHSEMKATFSLVECQTMHRGSASNFLETSCSFAS